MGVWVRRGRDEKSTFKPLYFSGPLLIFYIMNCLILENVYYFSILRPRFACYVFDFIFSVYRVYYGGPHYTNCHLDNCLIPLT